MDYVKSTREKTAIVIGAGVVGLTSALRLAEAGYVVTVLERGSKVCGGTSKANAGHCCMNGSARPARSGFCVAFRGR